MLTSFCAIDSKDLYFKLNNSLLMSDPFVESPTLKVSGLYAIYKNNICLYVGQSKNLASRLSTHLTGKYENCDHVEVFYISENHEDFYSKQASSQKEILEHNEKYLINLLKPIENIMVEREHKSDSSIIFDSLVDGPNPPYASIFVSVEKNNHICVTDDQHHCIYDLHKTLHGYHKDLLDNTKLVAK